MNRIPISRFVISAVVSAAALLLAGVAGAIKIPRPSLPAGWSHAEINVVIKHQPHTLIYDRGRVVAVTASALVLRERDGSVVTIAVSPTSQIKIAGQPAVLSQIRRLEIATTVGVDGGPAVLVSVQIPRGIAAAIARNQARLGSVGSTAS